eukprot:gene4478-28634_t
MDEIDTNGHAAAAPSCAPVYAAVQKLKMLPNKYDVGNPRKRTTSAAQQPGGRGRTSFGAGAGPSAGSAVRKRAVTVSAGMALKFTRQSPNGGTCKNNALPAQSSVTVTAAALQR